MEGESGIEPRQGGGGGVELRRRWEGGREGGMETQRQFQVDEWPRAA